MTDITILYLSLSDLCQATELPSETLIEITEEGIIEPIGSSPENWQFSSQTVAIAQKATRLHRDLGVDWPGIALALSLLDELEQLRGENLQLQQRLRRFSPNNEQEPPEPVLSQIAFWWQSLSSQTL